MGRVSERRALYYENDPDYDPFVGVDINEYLIEWYPTLSLKQRKAVWSSCQADVDFDFEAIHEQIDAWVDYLFNDTDDDDESDVSSD